MARPALETPSRLYRLTLSLRPGEDDDLITWLDAQLPRGRAQAVVTALRAGGVTLTNDAAGTDDAAMVDDLLSLVF